MSFNIAFVLYPDFEELDLAGPFEVFGVTAKWLDKEWRVFTVALRYIVNGQRGQAACPRPSRSRNSTSMPLGGNSSMTVPTLPASTSASGGCFVAVSCDAALRLLRRFANEHGQTRMA